MSIKATISITLALLLTACSTEQENRQLAYTGAGAASFASVAHYLGADKASTLLAGLLGANLGYTVSLPTLETVKSLGVETFQVGDTITILVPSDAVFEPASANLAQDGDVVLNALATYLSLYPHKNMLITANTANIGTKKFEDKISAMQAEKIAHFFEAQGINSFDEQRELRYVGLGSREPIASLYSAKGLYENRRIQMTLYENNTSQLLEKTLKDDSMEPVSA